jgi:ribosomal protein S12 methylthiotransferase accessory factor
VAALLRARESHHTFSDKPISAESLALILWAAHGVTRPPSPASPEWHRSVESMGNAHSTRWFVLILRPLPANDRHSQGLEPGLYEGQFHADGGASFDRIAATTATEAWRCVPDPRALSFASALILPACDVTALARAYGNRATLIAAVEAGQSIQNAQLMATALRVGSRVQGELIAKTLMELLEAPLGRERQIFTQAALLLGTQPTPDEVQRERVARWITVRQATPSATSSDIPLPVAGHTYVAGPIGLGSTDLFCSGRSVDPKEALAKAEAEAWERLGWATLKDTVTDRAIHLEGVVDPRAVISYTRAQYGGKDFPWTPYSTNRTYAWVSGVDTESGALVLLLSECIHALTALPEKFRRRAYTNTSTSGVAAWTDPEGALCRATMELVERDAFLRTWLARAPVPRMARNSLPGAPRQRIKSLEDAGYRVAVMQLASTLAPIIAVFVQSTMRPFTAITAAADLQPEVALTRALDEAEARALHAAAFPAKPMERASDVSSLQDIIRLYQSPRFYRHADFFAAGPVSQRFGTGPRLCKDWAAVKTRLAQQKHRLLAFELTPKHASIHQGRTPLHVVRAVIPGFIPIWFQQGLEPAGLAEYQAAIEIRAAHASRTGSDLIHPFT